MSLAAGILAPELLEQLKALVARARALVLGGGHGVHRSRRLGGGSEFSEYRSYAPGDDLRQLDWRVLGRTDRKVIKQYESDRRTDVQLLLDRSGSMAFGTTGSHPPTPWGVPWPTSKWDAARTLALGLAFVYLRQGDRAGITVVDGQGASRLPPRGGQRQLGELARQVVGREPVGEARLSDQLDSLLIRSRRSVVVVVSDLLAETEGWQRALAVHAARGREAWVIHVVDPAEISFPYDEPTLFVDLTIDTNNLNPRQITRQIANLALRMTGG